MRALIADGTMADGYRFVMLAATFLYVRDGTSGPQLYVRQQTLATEIGASISHVERAYSAARRLGWIERTQRSRRGRGNSAPDAYRLTIPTRVHTDVELPRTGAGITDEKPRIGAGNSGANTPQGNAKYPADMRKIPRSSEILTCENGVHQGINQGFNQGEGYVSPVGHQEKPDDAIDAAGQGTVPESGDAPPPEPFDADSQRRPQAASGRRFEPSAAARRASRARLAAAGRPAGTRRHGVQNPAPRPSPMRPLEAVPDLYCPRHKGPSPDPCRDCANQKQLRAAALADHAQRDGIEKARTAALRLWCWLCDDDLGQLLGPDGAPLDPVVRCDHPANAQADAERRRTATATADEQPDRWASNA